MKSTRLLKNILLILGFSGLSACDLKNPKHGAPVDTYENESMSAIIEQVDPQSKVDILFVVDNSASMLPFQQRLNKNIDRFVAEFGNGDVVDYHIGVVTIFDSTRYGKVVKNYIPNGELLPLKGTVVNGPLNFYTPQHKDKNLLAETLKVGVLPLRIGNEDVGPEYEEVFSPVVSALSDPMMSSTSNLNFYRPEAKLVIIFVTDANDDSPNLSAGEFDYFLRSIKNDPNREKISIYGVLGQTDVCRKFFANLYEEEHDPSYLKRAKGNPIDPSGEPKKIRELLSIAPGKYKELPLCSNMYGSFLAQLGQNIRVQSIHREVILNGRPELGTLKVSVSGIEVPQDEKLGWAYDAESNRIVINDLPKAILDLEGSIKVDITYRKVRLDNLQNGYTIPVN